MRTTIEAFKTWIDVTGQDKKVTVKRQQKFWDFFHTFTLQEKREIIAYLNSIKQ